MISIILPVYNVEDYLEECFESLARQTCKAFEVVVINDGSTDSSVEIIERWMESSLQVKFVEQSNKGLSGARNTGIRNASYNFIMFLDSDDRLHPSSIKKLSDVIESDSPNAVFFSAKTFGKSKLLERLNINDDMYMRRSWLFKDCENGCQYIIKSFEHNCYIKSACLYAFDRRVIPKVYFIEGIIHEDNHFTAELLLAVKSLVIIDLQLYERRVRDDSIMSSALSEKNVEGYYQAGYGLLRMDVSSFTPCQIKAWNILAVDCFWRTLVTAIKLESANVYVKWAGIIRDDISMSKLINIPLKIRLAFRFPRITSFLYKFKKLVGFFKFRRIREI